MKKIGIVLLSLLLLAAIGLNSCSSCNREDSTEQKKIEMNEPDNLTSEIGKAIRELPTSAHVAEMLTELDVEFMIGITNPAENADKYLLNGSKAINLGVYGADLSFCLHPPRLQRGGL